ncbi:hypothetical protein C0J52_25689, partial [Blattella germanica]
PQVKYTLEQRVFLFETYTRKRSYLKCRIRFIRKFPVRETGAFADKKRNRKITVLSEEKLDDIAACFKQSPHKSVSKLAQQITHKDYNPHTLDELKENIRQQIALISVDELQLVFRNFQKRCEACIRHGGHQFQHNL